MTRFIPHLITIFLASALIFGPGDQPEAQTSPTRIVEDLFARAQNASPRQTETLQRKILDEWRKTGSSVIDLLLRRGDAAIEQGRTRQAIGHLTAAIDHAPDVAEGYVLRAQAYLDAGLFGPAIADIEKALSLEPREFMAMYVMVDIFERLERPADAIGMLDMIGDLFPSDAALAARVARLRRGPLGTEI